MGTWIGKSRVHKGHWLKAEALIHPMSKARHFRNLSCLLNGSYQEKES